MDITTCDQRQVKLAGKVECVFIAADGLTVGKNFKAQPQPVAKNILKFLAAFTVPLPLFIGNGFAGNPDSKALAGRQFEVFE